MEKTKLHYLALATLALSGATLLCYARKQSLECKLMQHFRQPYSVLLSHWPHRGQWSNFAMVWSTRSFRTFNWEAAAVGASPPGRWRTESGTIKRSATWIRKSNWVIVGCLAYWRHRRCNFHAFTMVVSMASLCRDQYHFFPLTRIR